MHSVRHGESFGLPDTIAITIIAGLLSLLPVVILLWIYYVRERQPTVRGVAIARFFFFGMMSVAFAVLLERTVYALWQFFSPHTSQLFFAEGVFFADLPSFVIALLVSFGMIAVIEEFIRYLFFRAAFEKMTEYDQLIDGVQYGFALGLGFAFVENTLYFLRLFRGLDFDTLVVVFFLRFLISTVGHLSFGGVMGYYLGMARVFPTEQKLFLRRAFLFPWLMHGLFDTLLTVQLSFYAVLLLAIPLFIFWTWFQDPRMFELHALRGRRLRFPIAPGKRQIVSRRPFLVEVLPNMTSCPNCYISLSEQEKRCTACGIQLHRRTLPPLFPFLKEES